jgi:hypothetical protein
MIDHDRLFKELLTTFFVEFLELFFPEVVAYIERDALEFLDKEVFTDVTSGERYEADIINCQNKISGARNILPDSYRKSGPISS